MVTELEPGMLVGRYRLVERIAQGGMGTVWVARDEMLERDVAIKVLPRLLVTDPSAERRFEREARAMGRLQHPNVVIVFDVGSSDPGTGEELPFLVMELVGGQSLDKILERGALSVERAVRIFRQVARALAMAHNAGVIHRDLKPSNIMVDENDHVKVLDFGLARLVQQEGGTPEETLTTPGMVLGSCPYMAPEQALGQKVGPTSDLFSLGALMYEALSGQRAFDGETPMRVLQAVVKCDCAPLREVAPGLPDAVVTVVERCLQKDLSQRYQSAAEVARHLAALDVSHDTSSTGLPVVRRTAGAAPSGIRPGGAGLSRVILAAAAALVAGVAIGLVIAGVGRGGEAGTSHAPATEGSSPALLARHRPPPGSLQVHATFRPVPGADRDYFRLFPSEGTRLLAVVGGGLIGDNGRVPFPDTVRTEVATLVEQGLSGEILIRRLNTSLLAGSNPGGLSLAVAEIDLGRGVARIASAGHPPVALVRPDGSVEELAPGTRALGSRECRPETVEVAFPPGSSLILLSGWPVDARGRVFDVDNLATVLGEAVDLRPEDLQEIVLSDVHRLWPGQPPEDSVNVVVLSRAY